MYMVVVQGATDAGKCVVCGTKVEIVLNRVWCSKCKEEFLLEHRPKVGVWNPNTKGWHCGCPSHLSRCVPECKQCGAVRPTERKG